MDKKSLQQVAKIERILQNANFKYKSDNAIRFVKIESIIRDYNEQKLNDVFSFENPICGRKELDVYPLVNSACPPQFKPRTIIGCSPFSKQQVFVYLIHSHLNFCFNLLKLSHGYMDGNESVFIVAFVLPS